MRLLLLSNSTAPGRGYLEHAVEALDWALTGVRRVAFVPFALADHAGYTATVVRALVPYGVQVVGLHSGPERALLESADAVFIGGGNTFRLVNELYRRDLLDPLRSAVADGVPYLGSSAGTNVATPSLRTTNDMPIVEPPSFATLGLVPFQINPHYLDPDPASSHQGETRDERILQFCEENTTDVLAMREGTWLRRDGQTLTLEGLAAGARLYRAGEPTRELPAPADVSTLLTGAGEGPIRGAMDD
ncbi:MAG: dipeptidase PepE [Propioniciclava sp.]